MERMRRRMMPAVAYALGFGDGPWTRSQRKTINKAIRDGMAKYGDLTDEDARAIMGRPTVMHGVPIEYVEEIPGLKPIDWNCLVPGRHLDNRTDRR